MSNMFVRFKNDMREVWGARSILHSLVVKTLYGRYRNSFLGFAWNFITPLILMVMYYIVFTEIRGDSSIENKWAFISSSIFTFHYLASSITGGTGVFTGNVGMIKKMYIPKEILVLANSISSMIVCLIGNAIVLISLLITGYHINWSCVLLLPLILFLAFLFGIGCRFLLSSVAIYLRDLQYALGSISIALFVMTPMRYMASDTSGILSIIIWYNPLTYYVEFIHYILYWGVMPNLWLFLMCILISFTTLILGYVVFVKLRPGFVKRL